MDFVKAKTEGYGLPTLYEAEPGETWNSDIQVLWSRGQTARNLQFASSPTQVQCPVGTSELSDVYSLSQEIGRGSFGIVWSGRHKELQEDCVVKCVKKDNVGKDYVFIHATCDMFTLLLQMSQDTPHGNVIKYLDFLMGSSMIYVVMEELTGAELFKFMQDQAPMGLDVCQRLMKQLMSAVAHIHKMGIIHRDVKVDALRFRDSGPHSDLVLFDFGHCCFDGNDVQINIIGTATYMAPEQFTRRYNSKVDVWACGVILYILITGGFPFNLNKLNSGPRPPSKEELEVALNNNALKGVIPLACDLLSDLLTHDPQQRVAAQQALEHVWLATDGHAYPAYGLSIGKHLYLEAEHCAAKSEVFSFAGQYTPGGGRRLSTEALQEKYLNQDLIPPVSPQRGRVSSTEELQETFLDEHGYDDSSSASCPKIQSDVGETGHVGNSTRQAVPVYSYMFMDASTEALRESFEDSDSYATIPSMPPGHWNQTPRLGQSSSETSPDIGQLFSFRVPGSKLVSRENSVVLPSFDVSSEGKVFPFRMQIVAKKVHHKRFGQSFKTARGQGYLELKCDSSDPPSLDLCFQFGVGSCDKIERSSGQAAHNFLSSSIGRLPAGQDLWDFTTVVDPSTKCFSVFVHILWPVA